MDKFLNPLIEGTTLNVFNNNTLIFKSSSSWLYPLFELERFINNSKVKYDNLSAHDTVGGKAAAALMIKLNIKRINFDMVSEKAKSLLDQNNVSLFYNKLIPKLKCKTEDLFSDETSVDLIYQQIKIRAKQGIGLDVTIKDLEIGYNNKTIYKFDFLEIKGGDALIIEGDNGVGKTTFIKTLLREIHPISGTILIDNKPLNKVEPKTIGYIKQENDNQSFPISTKEVVSMGINKNLSKSEKDYLIDTSLRKCRAIDFINRNYYSLSGGEKQKVSLARCLCQKAKILLLDEPTSFLDKEGKKQLIKLLNALRNGEMPTIILITHDKDLKEQLNWKTYTMERDDV